MSGSKKKSPSRRARNIRRVQLYAACMNNGAPLWATAVDPLPHPVEPAKVAFGGPPSANSSSPLRRVFGHALRMVLRRWKSRPVECPVRGVLYPRPERPSSSIAQHSLPLEKSPAPAVTSSTLYEDVMMLMQLEAATTLSVVLSHLVRTLHPNGPRICFPLPEAYDQIVLRSCLPVSPNELLMMLQRLWRVLNLESEVYVC